ncbi:TPA: DUF4422 domain-containing protein [Klebsiella pneumoniae]|uniref:DUF4422 domain-containing protein n=2 Tax=Klebsiella pneumoniae TaxID=573 RepID=A0A1C3SZQ3_KLEPN|nr:DUF4422 domain-containing protein [Klebsiella pneumoniae]SCA95703.1 Uncharacterised protein [Klebsiella pneumoniae]HBX7828928.1 DUF4422 domain-containing protein [Klebsiella pneumoniae]HBX8025981.1 DUF4422 domain-containing protein [Klebsiella pneumoniae]
MELIMKIYVVAHKKFNVPSEEIYIPVKVGQAQLSFEQGVSDDTGDNISHLNDTFCEMTALYWIWKNVNILPGEIVGMVHYRRYFKSEKGNFPISKNEINSILSNYDILLPKKRNYYITTVENHYKKAHYWKDMQAVKNILSETNAEYLPYFEKMLSSKKVCLFNMFITKEHLFNAYCDWVFPILIELEKRIDRRTYDKYQNRVIGFIAERLFNVWILKNNNLNVKYVPVYNSEGESFIEKGIGFIKRQYFSKQELS